MIEVSANAITVVIILRYINASNQYMVLLKLTQRHISIISPFLKILIKHEGM